MDKNIATLIRPQTHIELTAAEKAAIQDKLVSFIESHPLPEALQQTPLETAHVPNHSTVSVFFSSRLLPSWRVAATALAVMVGVVGTGVGFAIAAQYSGPGDFLYPLKKNLDRVLAPRAKKTSTAPAARAVKADVAKDSAAAQLLMMTQTVVEIDGVLAQKQDLLQQLSATDQERFTSFLSRYNTGKDALAAGNYQAALSEFRAGATHLQAITSLPPEASLDILNRFSPTTLQFIQSLLLSPTA